MTASGFEDVELSGYEHNNLAPQIAKASTHDDGRSANECTPLREEEMTAARMSERVVDGDLATETSSLVRNHASQPPQKTRSNSPSCTDCAMITLFLTCGALETWQVVKSGRAVQQNQVDAAIWTYYNSVVIASVDVTALAVLVRENHDAFKQNELLGDGLVLAKVAIFCIHVIFGGFSFFTAGQGPSFLILFFATWIWSDAVLAVAVVAMKRMGRIAGESEPGCSQEPDD